MGGWACFWVSMGGIGMVTAVIGDLASSFGCIVGMKDSVTAISFVALGTSLPGKWVTSQDPYLAVSPLPLILLPCHHPPIPHDCVETPPYWPRVDACFPVQTCGTAGPALLGPSVWSAYWRPWLAISRQGSGAALGWRIRWRPCPSSRWAPACLVSSRRALSNGGTLTADDDFSLLFFRCCRGMGLFLGVHHYDWCSHGYHWWHCLRFWLHRWP